MCGIVGCYPMQEFTQVSAGLHAIDHRGPDAKSLHETAKGTLGHARLAILDVGSGHQPMTEQENLIVFNGEIYNYQALRRDMLDAVETDSDTEVVLKLYRACGPNFVNLLDGMFAFAILDQQGLFLARDPLGIKPLYYALGEEGIWFASEVKSLLGKATDIREFPPGHWWHSRHGMQRYYALDDLPERIAVPQAHPPADSLTLVQDTLREAVHKRLIADAQVPVGVSLSGGLDSSVVTALAREGRTTLDTFVVGMVDSEDIEASREVADYLGTRHHVYEYSFEEMLDVLPEVIYHLESFDAPLVRSAIPNYFLARLASDHVKVILLGEGADELFAGYAYMSEIDRAQTLDREMRTITKGLHNTNLQRADRMTMAHSIEGRVPFLDRRVIETAFDLPASWKLQRKDRLEKALLRRSVADLLSQRVVWRPKQKFSAGAGSMDMLAAHAQERISDAEFHHHAGLPDTPPIRSKEELLYYHIFQDIFGDSMSPDVVGMTRSITQDELN